MALDTTQQYGWAWEAAAETDPINAVDALYWSFGHYTTDQKPQGHPIKKQLIKPVYKTAKKPPSDMDIVSNTVAGQLAFYPTNGVPLFMVLAESASNGDDTFHTITDLAEGGTQPTFTVRSESTGGTVDKFFSAVGCKAGSISGLINLLSPFKFLSEVLTYNGINAAPSTSLNAVHTTGVKHCTHNYTMAGTQRIDRYKFDTNTLLEWNSNDIIDDVTMFKYDFVMGHDPKHVNNQADTEFLDEGSLTLSFDIGFFRGATNVDAIRTDYDAGTARTLSFDIFNGAATQREYTFSDALIMDLSGPYTTMGDSPLWVCHGMAEDISIKVTDNVADDYYKD